MWSSAEVIQHPVRLEAYNLEFLRMPNLNPEKGATISFHGIKYNVQVKPTAKCCAKAEDKEIIHNMRYDFITFFKSH